METHISSYFSFKNPFILLKEVKDLIVIGKPFNLFQPSV